MQNGLMRMLACRASFSRKFGVRYVDGPWPYLEINNPGGVARLVGEAKKKVHPDRVFLRGQVEHHDAMLPGLFRLSTTDPNILREAERTLIDRIRRSIPVKRFDRVDLSALLQHYGFRTSWLDAVDNLFVAAWFATNRVLTGSDSVIEVCAPSTPYGWLFLIATRPGSKGLRHVDLRVDHHPLSSRPHVQHGISLTGLDPGNCDLRGFIIATVRIPIQGYTTAGALFESSFLFPGREADHTLRLLVKHGANEIAASVEEEYKLSAGTLGRVSQLRAAS